MPSAKQIAANQRNAQKSTGPKTAAGKQAVRLNALRHGLLAQENLVPDEKVEEFEALQDAVWKELQPVGELENLLVERIISSTWRLRRLGRLEAALHTCLQANVYMRNAEIFEAVVGSMANPDAPEPPKAEPFDEVCGAAKATVMLMSAQGVMGQAFLESADNKDVFSKLSRYEAGIERSLYKALHELQRLQAARAGQHVPPPVAVEMNLSLSDMANEDVAEEWEDARTVDAENSPIHETVAYEPMPDIPHTGPMANDDNSLLDTQEASGSNETPDQN
jgi:hypothetical protein